MRTAVFHPIYMIPTGRGVAYRPLAQNRCGRR